MVVSWVIGVPPTHPFNMVFPWINPSIFGYPHDYGNPKMDDDWGKIDDHWGYTLVQETDKFGLL